MKKVTIKDISIALEESVEDTLKISKKIGFSIIHDTKLQYDLLYF